MTYQIKLDAAEIRPRLRGNHLLRDMTEAWFHKVPSITFHDPLAAATIFDNQICRFGRGTVEIELASERLRGLTYWTPGGPDSSHEVCVEVDRTRFFEHYFSIVR